jgi:transposase
MQKLVRTLRRHRPLLLNWFRRAIRFPMARTTERLNNKARSVTKRSYGFRSYLHAEVALFHSLGALPEPDWLTQRFW